MIAHTLNTVLTSGEWLKDWKAANYEDQAALYDNDIEKSLHLQGVLDLYPLHKRILGLVEYPIRKWLKDKAKERGVDWRSRKDIPTVELSSANGLVLTPESLKSCLVLISLVLAGCKSHLGFK